MNMKQLLDTVLQKHSIKGDNSTSFNLNFSPRFSVVQAEIMTTDDSIPFAIAVPMDHVSSSYGSIRSDLQDATPCSNKAEPKSARNGCNDEEDASSSSSWVSQWSGVLVTEDTFLLPDRKKIIWTLSAILLSACVALIYAAILWDKKNSVAAAFAAKDGDIQRHQVSVLSVMQQVHLRNELHN